MDNITRFLSHTVIPKLSKISKSVWIEGLYESKIRIFPMIVVGSMISVYSVVRIYLNWLPNLNPIKEYSYGLISLFMVYLIPYNIMKAKQNGRNKNIAGCTGISVYMILAKPMVTNSGYLYDFTHFGPDGMLVSVLAGIFTALIFTFSNNHPMHLRLRTLIPSLEDIIDATLPIVITIFTAWVLVFKLNVDIYSSVLNIFVPLKYIAQHPIGFILLTFLPIMFYSMGIGSWILQPIIGPVAVLAINENINLGMSNPFTNETIMAFIHLGGKGATLGLVFLMFKSKSKRLRSLGYASSLPALLNIGDPVTFGVLVWNPIMMIPMWINGIILPTITFLFIKIGIVPAPIFKLPQPYIPIGISGYLVTQSFTAILLVLINLIVSTLVWYPFFKHYEAETIQREKIH